MTKERGDIEQARFRLLKIARTAIYLKHRLAADDEINVQLPALEARFDAAVHNGELLDTPTLNELVGEVLGE